MINYNRSIFTASKSEFPSKLSSFNYINIKYMIRHTPVCGSLCKFCDLQLQGIRCAGRCTWMMQIFFPPLLCKAHNRVDLHSFTSIPTATYIVSSITLLTGSSKFSCLLAILADVLESIYIINSSLTRTYSSKSHDKTHTNIHHLSLFEENLRNKISKKKKKNRRRKLLRKIEKVLLMDLWSF